MGYQARASNNLFSVSCVFGAGTCLPNHCLATKRGRLHRTTGRMHIQTHTQTDVRDLRSAPFRFAQVAWYTFHVS
jgi:hypothetical protein